MRAVNLLPRDDSRGSGERNPVLLGAVVGAVAMTAILAAWFLSASTGVAANQKRYDAVQSELAATPVPTPASPGSSKLEQEKTARIAALSTALAGRIAWDRVLRELSLVLPDDVWLSTLSAQAPTPGATGAAAAAGLTLSGQTYSHDGVARLLTRLALVPQLAGVTLQHSSLSASASGARLVEFTIGATIKPAGAV